MEQFYFNHQLQNSMLIMQLIVTGGSTLAHMKCNLVTFVTPNSYRSHFTAWPLSKYKAETAQFLASKVCSNPI